MRGVHQSPVNSPHKGQWRGSLMFFFDLRLDKRLSKPLKCLLFETPSHSLWGHCNVLLVCMPGDGVCWAYWCTSSVVAYFIYKMIFISKSSIVIQFDISFLLIRQQLRYFGKCIFTSEFPTEALLWKGGHILIVEGGAPPPRIWIMSTILN